MKIILVIFAVTALINSYLLIDMMSDIYSYWIDNKLSILENIVMIMILIVLLMVLIFMLLIFITSFALIF